jgi:hypothetical protein
MALPIPDRNLDAQPLTNSEMVEMLTAWADDISTTGPSADPVGKKFADGVVKYLSARPVLMRDLAQAADTRFDGQGA